MLHIVVLVIASLCIINTKGQATVRYSSSCSVPLCGSSNAGSGSTCTASTLCYSFQSVNETICAPQVICSLFDECISGTHCATNTSICIINSCCSEPICMPRALTSACVPSSSSGSNNASQNITTPPLSSSGVAIDSAPVPIAPLSATIRLCSNATWDANYSTISWFNGTNRNNFYTFPPSVPTDIFLDSNNTIYVADSGNYRIQKFQSGNPTGVTVALSGSFSPIALYVDGAGTIYSCEEAFGVLPFGRLQKYAVGNINGITLLGGAGNCGTAVNQLCGCGGIYVDRQGLLYISDTYNHRVLLYNTTAGSISVVAGTSGIGGTQPYQLYYPYSIYVDGNNNLFVVNMLNGVQKFTPGSAIGMTIVYGNFFVWGSGQYYQGTPMISDSLGSFYFGGTSIQRWTPNTMNLTSVFNGSLINLQGFGIFGPWYSALRFDTMGSLYMVANSMLIKFNLLSNSC